MLLIVGISVTNLIKFAIFNVYDSALYLLIYFFNPVLSSLSLHLNAAVGNSLNGLYANL